jgi:hypothetical protein
VKLGVLDWGNKCLSHRWAIQPLRSEHKPIKNRINQRLKWLNLQFDNTETTPLTKTLTKLLTFLPFVRFDEKKRKVDLWRFETFPYLQAARAFRKEGVYEHARKIDYQVRKYSGLKYAKSSGLPSLLIYPLHYLYQISSKFGLSPILTFIWLTIMILCGGLMTDVANHKGLLIVQTTTLSSNVDTIKGRSTRFLEEQNIPPPINQVCGHAIDTILFAADVFLPLVELGQEKKCVIGEATTNSPIQVSKSDGTFYHSLRSLIIEITPSDMSLWRWGRSIYTILGWVMLSLFIFALTNRLRLPENNH